MKSTFICEDIQTMNIKSNKMPMRNVQTVRAIARFCAHIHRQSPASESERRNQENLKKNGKYECECDCRRKSFAMEIVMYMHFRFRNLPIADIMPGKLRLST